MLEDNVLYAAREAPPTRPHGLELTTRPAAPPAGLSSCHPQVRISREPIPIETIQHLYQPRHLLAHRIQLHPRAHMLPPAVAGLAERLLELPYRRRQILKQLLREPVLLEQLGMSLPLREHLLRKGEERLVRLVPLGQPEQRRHRRILLCCILRPAGHRGVLRRKYRPACWEESSSQESSGAPARGVSAVTTRCA
jgi:hypothetical protein